MARWEIMKRFGPLQGLWWRFMPGVEIEVPWPVGNIVVDDQDPRWIDMGGAVRVDLGFSSDPNDHYRPWLEENVGRQGWDWNWRMGQVSTTSNERDTLVIKIRRAKSEYATIAVMRWV